MYAEKYKQQLDEAFQRFSYQCYISHRRVSTVLWIYRFIFVASMAIWFARYVGEASTYLLCLSFFLCGYSLALLSRERTRISEAVQWANASRNVCVDMIKMVEDEYTKATNEKH